MTSFVPKKEAKGFIMPNFIQKNKKLSLGAKYLFGVLCDYARDKAFCYPSKKTLAKVVQCSVNSIRNWLKELVENGYVKSIFNGRIDVFYLYCPADYLGDANDVDNEGNAQDDTDNAAKMLRPQDEMAQGEKERESQNKSNSSDKKICSDHAKFAHNRPNFEPKSNLKLKLLDLTPTPFADETTTSQKKIKGGNFSKWNEEFEKAWNIYPKKEAKESARSLWHRFFRQGKIPSFGVFKESIDFFYESSSWQRENGRYIPQFVNFIRGLRWNDAPKKVLVSQKIKQTVSYEIESPMARDARISKEKQELENKTQVKVKVIDEAFSKLKGFFKTTNSIENCIAFALFSNLYEKQQIPFAYEKQNISLVEFLKKQTQNGV